MKRRSFLKALLAVGVAAAVPGAASTLKNVTGSIEAIPGCPDSVVIINKMGDFPVQDEETITLQPGVTYQISMVLFNG